MKVYLGDAVYVDVDREMLKLTTEDGIRTTNTIYLEGVVFDALCRYVKRLREAAGQTDDAAGE